MPNIKILQISHNPILHKHLHQILPTSIVVSAYAI